MPENTIDQQVIEALLAMAKSHIDILREAPVSVLIIDEDGKILSANQTAKQSIGFDPTGKSLFEIFNEKVAKRRLKNVRTALNKKDVIIDRDSRDFRHFLSHYYPLDFFNSCAVIATEITEMVRIQNILKTVQKIRRTIIHSSSLNEIITTTGESLKDLEGVAYVKIRITKRDCVPSTRSSTYPPKQNDITWEYNKPNEHPSFDYTFPLSVSKEMIGEVKIATLRKLSEEEKVILQAVFDEIAYNIKLVEMKETLARNIVEIALLIDGIRNPLSAILLNTELHGGPDLHEKVRSQVTRIISLLRNLDEKWIESEKIIKTLKLFP